MTGKYWALALLLFLGSCSEKNSRQRFEEASGLKLPANAEIVRNEHIDAGKDYGIDFRVQLGPEERRKYAEQIRASGKFRNDNAERDNTWQPTGRGFKFFRAKDGVFYNIEVDTVSGLVRYNELG